MKTIVDHRGLVSDWLFHLERGDLARLGARYQPGATLRLGTVTYHGTAAIVSALAAEAPGLRELVVCGVRWRGATATHATFDTSLQTRAGHASLRHHVRIRDGRIHHHEIHVTAFVPHNSVPDP